MKRRIVGITLLSVGACFGDLLVGPKPNLPPLLFINLDILHREQPSYLVDAGFLRGSDAQGRPRALIDSFIVVEDSVLFGVATSATTLQFTRIQLPTTSVGRDTITVKGPVVAGLPSSGLTINVPIPVREDPFFREHVAGEDLLLTVSPLSTSIDGLLPGNGQWNAEVRDAREDRTIFKLEGRGPYPSPLPIPRQLLPSAPGDSLSASLTYFWGHQAANSPYEMSVVIRGNFIWQLRIVAP